MSALSQAMPAAAYPDAGAHLFDEFARIDLLVRAATAHWIGSAAATKAHRHWGLAYVGGREVEAYLAGRFVLGEPVTAEARREVDRLWSEAADLRSRIDERLDATLAARVPPIRQLAELFDLDALSYDVLLVCLLAERDNRYRRLYAYLQDDATRVRPSAGLVARLLSPLETGPECWHRVFSPASPLIRGRLLTLGNEPGGTTSLALRPVQIEDRVVSFVYGSDVPDERVADFVVADPCEAVWDPRLAADVTIAGVRNAAAQWLDHAARGAGLHILLQGAEGSGRLSAAQAICRWTNTPLLRVDVESALADSGAWPLRVSLCIREAMLRGAAIYWDGADRLAEDETLKSQWDCLLRACREFRGLALIGCGPGASWRLRGRDQAPVTIRFAHPRYELRRRHWQALLPEGSFRENDLDRDALCDRLAGSFQITFGQARQALASAVAEARPAPGEMPSITPDGLVDACRRQSTGRLVGLARRVEPQGALTFDDLILPPASKKQVLELRDRIVHHRHLLHRTGLEGRLSYGHGLVAMFAGPSGTGKTMTAELLARERGADLYKVDLASIVSKFVGETEKNLKRLFDEAEYANAIVFLDEGESLMGQRGRIVEGQDRWANQEVNYLLQRIEEYSGVVIVATNLRQNIDEAFLRRIHCIVDYPLPDEQSRRALWRRMAPASFCTLSESELRDLAARFPLSGGSIRNVIVDASYRALAASAPGIRMRDAITAVAREYQKCAKPLSRAEFGAEFYNWVVEDIIQPGPAETPA